MEYKKNTDLIKIIFKMKDTEKSIINLSNQLIKLKVLESSGEGYKECLSYYNEGSCYYFQCCGFLKSQYFSTSISGSSKEFLIKNLLIPAYKKFLLLNRNIALIKVDSLYEHSLKSLREKIELINISLFELQKELAKLE